MGSRRVNVVFVERVAQPPPKRSGREERWRTVTHFPRQAPKNKLNAWALFATLSIEIQVASFSTLRQELWGG